MGKPTGFMEFERLEEGYEPVEKRLTHYKEFVQTLSDDQAKTQGARCMDCGIPFCNNGCPVNNIIPDWNDLVYRGKWEQAIRVLHSTNNFPEFTGRICPAPCEAACTLGINAAPVGIKSIERAIIDRAWENGWVKAQPAAVKSGKKVAVVGAGPAGLAAAQQLARVGHEVTLFEKNDRVGGLLRYGIPDFKLDKAHIDRRVAQLVAEGVQVRTGVFVGAAKDGLGKGSKVTNWAKETVTPEQLNKDFDAVLLTGGAEQSRDLPVPGRDLDGIHFAMEFLPQQNKVNAGDKLKGQLRADGKHVIVIGGGDTGSDCVGTSNRHGAKSVTQFEVMPMPPEEENKPLVWPYWPLKLRTSSSHEEGCTREFAISTKEFVGKGGKVTGLKTVQVEFKDGKFVEIPGTEKLYPADSVIVSISQGPCTTITDSTKNLKTTPRGLFETDEVGRTSIPGIFASGDAVKGARTVVEAVAYSKNVAEAMHEYMQTLPPDLPDEYANVPVAEYDEGN